MPFDNNICHGFNVLISYEDSELLLSGYAYKIVDVYRLIPATASLLSSPSINCFTAQTQHPYVPVNTGQMKRMQLRRGTAHDEPTEPTNAVSSGLRTQEMILDLYGVSWPR